MRFRTQFVKSMISPTLFQTFFPGSSLETLPPFFSEETITYQHWGLSEVVASKDSTKIGENTTKPGKDAFSTFLLLYIFNFIPPGKVDGATPLYWFFMAPYKSPPFGSCAIYFHHGVYKMIF